MAPESKAKITLPFGAPHPTTGTHEGIDLVFPDLLFRYPFEKGRCLYIGNEPTGLGLYCVFRWVETATKHTRMVVAGHFERIDIKVGELVFLGRVIGKQGMTGNATGIHTHLELHAPIDPEPFLAD